MTMLNSKLSLEEAFVIALPQASGAFVHSLAYINIIYWLKISLDIHIFG